MKPIHSHIIAGVTTLVLLLLLLLLLIKLHMKKKMNSTTMQNVSYHSSSTARTKLMALTKLMVQARQVEVISISSWVRSSDACSHLYINECEIEGVFENLIQ